MDPITHVSLHFSKILTRLVHKLIELVKHEKLIIVSNNYSNQTENSITSSCCTICIFILDNTFLFLFHIILNVCVNITEHV